MSLSITIRSTAPVVPAASVTCRLTSTSVLGAHWVCARVSPQSLVVLENAAAPNGQAESSNVAAWNPPPVPEGTTVYRQPEAVYGTMTEAGPPPIGRFVITSVDAGKQSSSLPLPRTSNAVGNTSAS